MHRPTDPQTRTFGDYPSALQTYAFVVFVACSAISLAVFLFGLAVVYIQRRVWKNSVFRGLLVIQFMNFIRFLTRILLTSVTMHNEAGCRIVLALSNMSSHLVVYLCAYMVIYLELVIIHNLSPHARWPRVILATICVLCSVGPQFVYLTIPRETVGLESFCDLPLVVNDQLYHVIIGTVVAWALLAGIASFVSMSIVAVHIRRTSRRARRISNIMIHEGMPGIYSSKDVGRSTADLLNQTLKSTVWFPITPVASLWFNSALVFVRFYSQRPYYNLEYINISLFSLMTVFMAVAFFFNPMVMGFLRDYRRSWKASKCGHPQNNIQRSPIGLRIRVNSLFSSGTLADFVS